MNTYQEIVNSVQANILVPVTQLEEKNTLREKLDRELEEFFAKGGKPKVLAMGETEYRDGKVPMRSVQKKKDIVVVETPSEVILQKNKVIKELKTKAVQQTKVKDLIAADLKKKRIEKQADVLSEFYKKANKVDYSNLASKIGLTTRQLRDATKSREITDLQLNKLISEISSFEYYVKPKRIREYKPRKKRKDGLDQVKERERKRVVRDAKQAAIKKGLSHFTSICQRHSESNYIIESNGNHRCILCKNEAVRKNYEKNIQTKEMSVNYSRKLRNRDEMLKAVSSEENIFIGECLKHGSTDFYLIKNPHVDKWVNASTHLYKCKACTKEQKDKMSEKLRIVREKAKQ